METPFIETALFVTVNYFSYFLILLPFLGFLENSFVQNTIKALFKSLNKYALYYLLMFSFNSFFSLFINTLIAFTLGRSSLVFLVSNPIHSILSLIGVFFLGTCLLFFIQIEYYAILFLIVYVGAIVVLFLFIIRILELKMVNITQSLYNSYLIHYSLVLSFFLFALLIVSETLFNLRFIINSTLLSNLPENPIFTESNIYIN